MQTEATNTTCRYCDGPIEFKERGGGRGSVASCAPGARPAARRPSPGYYCQRCGREHEDRPGERLRGLRHLRVQMMANLDELQRLIRAEERVVANQVFALLEEGRTVPEAARVVGATPAAVQRVHTRWRRRNEITIRRRVTRTP